MFLLLCDFYCSNYIVLIIVTDTVFYDINFVMYPQSFGSNLYHHDYKNLSQPVCSIITFILCLPPPPTPISPPPTPNPPPPPPPPPHPADLPIGPSLSCSKISSFPFTPGHSSHPSLPRYVPQPCAFSWLQQSS